MKKIPSHQILAVSEKDIRRTLKEMRSNDVVYLPSIESIENIVAIN